MILLWIHWLYEVYYQNQFHLFLSTFLMWLLEHLELHTRFTLYFCWMVPECFSYSKTSQQIFI